MKKKGRYRGIPIYITNMDDFGVEIEGRNWFYDLLVELMISIDVYIIMVDEFEIEIEVDKSDDEMKRLWIKED